jgi:hypothetical protein
VTSVQSSLPAQTCKINIFFIVRKCLIIIQKFFSHHRSISYNSFGYFFFILQYYWVKILFFGLQDFSTWSTTEFWNFHQEAKSMEI